MHAWYNHTVARTVRIMERRKLYNRVPVPLPSTTRWRHSDSVREGNCLNLEESLSFADSLLQSHEERARQYHQEAWESARELNCTMSKRMRRGNRRFQDYMYVDTERSKQSKGMLLTNHSSACMAS